MPSNETALHGRRLGLGFNNELLSNDLNVTMPAVQATITVGDESADVRAITITLKDSNGVAINYAQEVGVNVFADSAGAAWAATGGSTGIAVGASGALLTVVSKKRFIGRTTTAGVLALTWTDSGTEAAYLGIVLPTGRTVISSALTNA